MDLGGLKPGGAASAGLIKDGTSTSFGKDVIEASRDALVLVDFWAAWCGPCKQLTPIIEKVVKSYAGKVRLVKIDTDAHPAIAGQLRIQSLPTVYAFRDGRPVDGFTGAQPESQVRAFIDRALGDDGEGDIAAVIEAGRSSPRRGRPAGRRRSVRGRAAGRPAERASDRRPRALLFDQRRPRTRRTDVEPRAAGQAIEARPCKAHAPHSNSPSSRASPTTAAELEQRLAANPADHQTRFDLAVALAARGKKDVALTHLLEIVQPRTRLER